MKKNRVKNQKIKKIKNNPLWDKVNLLLHLSRVVKNWIHRGTSTANKIMNKSRISQIKIFK